MHRLKWMLFVLLLFLGSFATHAEVRLSLADAVKDANITTLSWDSFTYPLVVTQVAGQDSPQTLGDTLSVNVVLSGKYSDPNGTLIYRGAETSSWTKIPVDNAAEGSFQLPVSIHGDQTEIEFLAITQLGLHTNDVYELELPNFEQELEDLKNRRWKLDWKFARASWILLTNSTGSVVTPLLSWNPRYGNSKWRIQGNLGVAPLRNANSYFFDLEYGLIGAVLVYPQIWLEASLGMQLWTDYSTHAPAAGMNGVYQLKTPLWHYIEQIVIGYSVFCAPNNMTSEIKAGVGIKF